MDIRTVDALRGARLQAAFEAIEVHRTVAGANLGVSSIFMKKGFFVQGAVDDAERSTSKPAQGYMRLVHGAEAHSIC